MREIKHGSNVAPIDRTREKRPARMPNQVRILVILDRSGSMKAHEGTVVENLRAFFGMLRKGLPAGSQGLVTLTPYGPITGFWPRG